MIEPLVINISKAVIEAGAQEFCICPGARNASFINLLEQFKDIRCYYFYDERSAAFFALGRAQATNQPVGIITTSGTAPAHLLAATMEAYYTRTPLILITADRPRHYRGKNAPQSAEQVNLFGQYTPFNLDLAGEETCILSTWDGRTPMHINVCLDEPSAASKNCTPFSLEESSKRTNGTLHSNRDSIQNFFSRAANPFVVVSTLKPRSRAAIVQFLVELNVPVYLEGISGLRNDPRLQQLSINNPDELFNNANRFGYPIDSILRIGGVPTARFWRDLEYKQQEVAVLSLNDTPYAGLSWGEIDMVDLESFFSNYSPPRTYNFPHEWKLADEKHTCQLEKLLTEEPTAEPSLIHALSKKISPESLIYLGNSLPIREWDMAACRLNPHANVWATRALNGIDGQISIFAGLCQSDIQNWAILGDLTTLYDLSGPWIFSQLPSIQASIVVINNGGGKIFARMFSEEKIQNKHSYTFEPVADLWNLEYLKLNKIPLELPQKGMRLIEIVPEEEATKRFWEAYQGLS